MKVPEKVSGTFTRDVADFQCYVAVTHWAMDKAMHIISIIRIILMISIISIILIMRIICRFVRILDLRITCGRTRGQQSPSPLITWAISFVLPCVPDGFHTSVVPTQRMPRTMLAALLWEKASSWSQIESTLLLDATNNVPP